MRTYVIAGATGHIGQRIVETFPARGDKVKVIARNRGKLNLLLKEGAEPYVGSLDDTDFLTTVFTGADAVFAMIPPDLQAENVRASQARVGTSIVKAVKKAGVKYVVNLSSQGAYLPEGTGPIAGLHEQEERLNEIPGVNVVHLRAAFFAENLANSLGLIKSRGVVGTPLRGDLKIPVIATRDIAHAAVEYLAELRFTGKEVRDLLGQRDLSMLEMTRILGEAIGKPDLQYVRFSYEAAREAMLGMGLSKDVARAFIEMYEALNEGRIMQGFERTLENTTETRFEDFAVELARLYAVQPPVATPTGAREEDTRPPEQTKEHRALWDMLHRHRAA